MKQASKQKLRQDCLGSNKTLADLFTNYFRILPKLLAELQENHLKVLKETVAWRTERKKHPMVLRPRRKREAEPESSLVPGDCHALGIGRWLSFHPRPLEEELQDIAFDLDKKSSSSNDIDPYVLEASDSEESVDLMHLTDEIFRPGDRVRLHYFNRVAGSGRILSLEGEKARVVIEDLEIDLGKRFNRPLPFGQKHWLRKTSSGFKFTTKEILWETLNLEKIL